jgi:hypothetical protein
MFNTYITYIEAPSSGILSKGGEGMFCLCRYSGNEEDMLVARWCVSAVHISVQYKRFFASLASTVANPIALWYD